MKPLVFKTHNNTNVQAELISRFEANFPAAVIEFSAEYEDISPADQFEDKKLIDSICRRLDRGDLSAWFTAKVTVTYRGYEAYDYLGACSYNSFKEFKQDPYYADMISTCVDEINRSIAADNQNICTRFKVRQLKRQAEQLGFYLIPKTAIA